MWDGWAVVIESRDIKLHGLLTSATIVRVVTLTLWKLLRFFELIYLPAVCTIAFVSAISGFSPTVFGCSVIEYHLFRGGERERERSWRLSNNYSRDHAALSNIVAVSFTPFLPPSIIRQPESSNRVHARSSTFHFQTSFLGTRD